MGSSHPSMPHLERHQRDLEEYRHNVHSSAPARFGPAWWGLWDQHVQPPQDPTIVDLGAGTGHLLQRLRVHHPTATLIGVEVHPELLAQAREAAESVDAVVIEGDLAVPVPLDDGSADVVVSSLTLHEVPYPPALLANAARILRPGGRLVLFDIVKWPLATYLADRELDADSLDHFREHCLFTPDDLAWLVDHAGITVDEVVTRSGGRFAMIFGTRR